MRIECENNGLRLDAYLAEKLEVSRGFVKKMFEERFPRIPKVYLWAPVCRPGWLIEMECMAVKAIQDNRFPAY